MPHRMWNHACACEQGSTTGHEICPRCGQAGTFAGWTRSVVEHMGHHERRMGYPLWSQPIAGGWHHFDARQYGLPSLKHDCPKCDGLGLVDVGQGRDYRICEDCHGDGGLPNYPPEVMRAYQEQARRLWELQMSMRPGRHGVRFNSKDMSR